MIGFSVGGEYTGVVAYLLEGAAANRRGLITSSASAASEIGGAAGRRGLGPDGASAEPAELDGWGWRIPFLVGAALAGSVWIARSAMQESPDFERQRAAGTTPDQPLRYTLAHHRKGILRSFAISALGSITYYVGITYVPAFLTSAGALTRRRRRCGCPPWRRSWSSWSRRWWVRCRDRLGPQARAGRVWPAAAPFCPSRMFSLMASGSAAARLVGAVMLAAVAGGVSAVGAVATAEQFPGEGRLSGLALGTTTATAIFGGLTPWLAQLLVERTGWPVMPGVMIAVVGMCVLPVFWTMVETAP